eukprot:TRINITY_DN6166_c0_g1_i1.p1 TRINITY_DN6166_c0_g1~~TRINITY_DN6166_c0_g1_i1.p1  ORF type:complete len:754 (+),score=215.71 TRINITY_DN6166_c0_g1_i1:96-2264(+)
MAEGAPPLSPSPRVREPLLCRVVKCPCILMQCVIERAYAPDDDYETKMKKRPVVVCLLLSLLFLSVNLVQDTVRVTRALTGSGSVSLGNLKTMLMWVNVYEFAYLLIRRRLGKYSLHRLFIVSAALIVSTDWSGVMEATSSTAYGAWMPTWQMGVILMDAVLVTRLGRVVETVVVGALFSWVFIRATEDCYRWGLYDVSSPNRTDTYWLCPEEGGVCAAKCSADEFFHVLWRSVFVLLLDFVITRGFRDQTNAAIALAEDVAAAMVRFDLKEAEERLESASDAPYRMKQGFRELVENLHRYRPFLPDALFEMEAEQSEEEAESQRQSASPGSSAHSSAAGSSPSKRQSKASAMESAAGSAGSRMSMSSQASRASRVSNDAKKERQLQIMQLGLTKRQIVVLCVGLRPWEWVAQAATAEAEALVASWLEPVWSAGKQFRATVLGVRGQMATLVWGSMQRVAVTPASLKVASCAQSIVLSLGQKKFRDGVRVCCGCGAGNAQVGNVGSAEFREHALAGPLPSTARTLALFAEYCRVSTMCDKTIAMNVENEFEVRHADRWRIAPDDQKEDRGADKRKPYDVFELQREKPKAKNDEWMYQLEEEEAKKKGQAAHFGEGIELLMGKVRDPDGAAASFRRHLSDSPDDCVARILLAAALSAVHTDQPYARTAWRDGSWTRHADDAVQSVPGSVLQMSVVSSAAAPPRSPEPGSLPADATNLTSASLG